MSCVATTRGEIVVPYQRIVDLETLAAVSFEALARWRHPHDGFVPRRRRDARGAVGAE